MKANWIWCHDGHTCENERIYFQTEFCAKEQHLENCMFSIGAVTKYAVYLNGEYIGNGPIRSPRSYGFYDTYEIGMCLKEGINVLTIEVWNYGWSTYQSLAEEGGLIFEVTSGSDVLLISDERTLCRRNRSFLSFSPKRNANLGFTDYIDARVSDGDWIAASAVCKDKKLNRRPIRLFQEQPVWAQKVISVEDVRKNVRVFSVNTRYAFFPGRTDADETTINGLLGCEICTEKEIRGTISFPNRTWNGIIGTFRIGRNVYEVTDARRNIDVVIPEGKNLFLMQLHGTFDDLYSHIEFSFEEEFDIAGLGTDRCFFTAGPTCRIVNTIDGIQSIKGLPEEFSAAEKELFSCETLEQLEEKLRSMPDMPSADITWVERRYVMEDAYLLSLARLAKPVRSYAIGHQYDALLWNNSEICQIDPCKEGDYRRILLDLGDEYVGQIEFTVKAKAGTVLDLYGFENRFAQENDYTIGLNNAIRYICREGWQHFRGMARVGMRYILLSVRNTAEPVFIKALHLNYATYSVTNSGAFECDDEKLNKVWQMCRQTHRLCLEDTFTDCPTYEQAFWLGDAQTSAVVNAYVYGDYPFIRHNILLASCAQENSPLFNALAPTDWNTSIPMWTMNWIISLSDYLQVSGDESILSEVYEKVQSALHYYETLLTREGGFVVNSWNLIDWAHLDTPEGYVLTAYQGLLAFCYKAMSGFAHRLNKTEDEAHYAMIAEKMLRFIDEKLWIREENCFCDAWDPQQGYSSTRSVQTHSLLFLYEAIRDPKKKEYTRSYLRKLPQHFVDAGSPFMLYYYYEAKCREGLLGEVFEDIKERWGEMIRYESTTCWEVFPGFYENSRTRSYCHSWSSSPAALMQKYLLGVTQAAEGFKKIAVRMPETSLVWCRGDIPTPVGNIHVEWNSDLKEYSITLPKAIEMHSELPADYQVRVTCLEN